ncbi:MAG: GAF domain-containing sensor histidine kinase [Verrucomicrobia bacterium]|nr:GAF domain-containing sensor histidine kinase [Verrucomicrobiota bacterium]
MKTHPLCGQALDNPHRLDVLVESGLLDSLPEESFDRYTRITAILLKAEVSLVSFVDDRRQFFKSQVGLPSPYDKIRETALTHSFCQFVVREGVPLVVEDARKDVRLCDNGAIRDLGVISYLGMPITSQEGFLLGSLCAINTHPRNWSEEEQRVLADLAGAVSAEVHLRQSELTLKKSLGFLQKIEEQRDRSLQMLVHDLRNPAAAIVSLADLLVSTPPELTGEQQTLVHHCRESAEGLLAMIDELLVINRAQADHEAESRSAISVSSLLGHAARMISPLLKSGALQLSVDYPESGGSISGDSNQIHRVLLNLLNNAAKFSPANSVISLSARPDSLNGEEGFRFEVRDKGPGVPENEKEAIFEQYFSGSVEGKRGLKSFGIGLAFCKMVVEAHHGQIGVEDAPGGGSVFYFFLS